MFFLTYTNGPRTEGVTSDRMGQPSEESMFVILGSKINLIVPETNTEE